MYSVIRRPTSSLVHSSSVVRSAITLFLNIYTLLRVIDFTMLQSLVGLALVEVEYVFRSKYQTRGIGGQGKRIALSLNARLSKFFGQKTFLQTYKIDGWKFFYFLII